MLLVFLFPLRVNCAYSAMSEASLLSRLLLTRACDRDRVAKGHKRSLATLPFPNPIA